MNRSTRITTLIAALVLTTLAVSTGYGEPTADLKKKASRTDTIPVPEMQCGMCESRIEKAVKGLDGVSSASADAEANHVIVTYNPKTVSRESIEKTIAASGYDAGEATTTPEAQSKLHACCRPGAHEE